MFPFHETNCDNTRIRTFEKDVSVEELVWHRDAKDRIVKIIDGTGWYFQFDHELPFELRNGDVLEIPKEKWHRVIRKNNCEKLTIEILEL